MLGSTIGRSAEAAWACSENRSEATILRETRSAAAAPGPDPERGGLVAILYPPGLTLTACPAADASAGSVSSPRPYTWVDPHRLPAADEAFVEQDPNAGRRLRPLNGPMPGARPAARQRLRMRSRTKNGMVLGKGASDERTDHGGCGAGADGCDRKRSLGSGAVRQEAGRLALHLAGWNRPVRHRRRRARTRQDPAGDSARGTRGPFSDSWSGRHSMRTIFASPLETCRARIFAGKTGRASRYFRSVPAAATTTRSSCTESATPSAWHTSSSDGTATVG